MTNALQKQADKQAPTLRQRLNTMAPEFKKALPGHIPVDRFIRTVQTAIQMNPDIDAAATKSTEGMQSFFAACTKAATDGLILDDREAALVTFNQKVSKKGEKDRWALCVQYLPMVAGIMKKARNSGEISSISAHVVYKNDKFEYVLGDDEKISHGPAFGDRGEPIAVYAVVRLKDGSIQREVMDRAAVMRIAGQSKNAWQYDPAKGKNYGEWWRKTVIRRVSKYLPSSSDRDEFMQAVSRIDDDFDFSQTIDHDDAPVDQPARKKRGGGAAALSKVSQDNVPIDDQGEAVEGEIIDQETGEILDADSEQQQPGDDI